MESRANWALAVIFLAGCVLAGLTYWIGTEMEKGYLKERETFEANYTCPSGHRPAQFYRNGPWHCASTPIPRKKD